MKIWNTRTLIQTAQFVKMKHYFLVKQSNTWCSNKIFGSARSAGSK
jgi:hypothetical protein